MDTTSNSTASRKRACLTEDDFRSLCVTAKKADRIRIRRHLEVCARCRDSFLLWTYAEKRDPKTWRELAKEGVLQAAGVAVEAEPTQGRDTELSSAQLSVLVKALTAGLSAPVPDGTAVTQAAPLSQPAASSAGQISAEGFEILRELGAGGMGRVYLARDIRLGRTVALKTLQPQYLSVYGRERFVNEVQAAARLNHPHIVPVYECHLDEAVPFFTMQYVDGPCGRTLIDRLSTARAHTLAASKLLEAIGMNSAGVPESIITVIDAPGPYYRLVAHWLAGVAEAVHSLHEIGIWHRDIKPGNLMLSPDGRMMITDFGLARSKDDPDLTQPESVIGSSRYLSPERLIGGRAYDHRTDVYALGATLYEFLTYQHANIGEDQPQVLARIVSKEPDPPRRIMPSVPTELERICLKAMARDPQRRYASARVLAQDLQTFLREASGPSGRFRRWGMVTGFAVSMLPMGLFVFPFNPPAPPMQEKVQPATVTPDRSTDAQLPESSPGPISPQGAGSVARLPAPTQSTGPGIEARPVLTQPASVPSHEPSVLLAFVEDPDTSDSEPGQPGGDAQNRLERLIEEHRELRLVYPSIDHMTSAWSRESALTAAREAGADYVLLGVSRTAPVREVQRIGRIGTAWSTDVNQSAGQTQARHIAQAIPDKLYAEWRTDLAIDVVRVSDRKTLREIKLQSDSAIQTRGAAVIRENLRKAVDEAVTQRGLFQAILDDAARTKVR